MSRIYEALQQAQRERKGWDQPELSLPQFLETPFPGRPQGFDVEKEMINLYQSIGLLLPDVEKKVIQFMGSRPGEGTSTIVREFAWVAARKLNRTVLLLDADRSNPNQHLAFNVRPRHSWEDFLRDDREDKEIDELFCQIGESRLFLSPISPRSTSSPQVFDSLKMEEFFKELRQRFDLVLVDSPPATISSDGMALCRLTDGLVLVLEAEETRWQVAERVKEQAIMNGGNILGLVFNKRRYHIPDFIQRRL